jgi:hypothetical protein
MLNQLFQYPLKVKEQAQLSHVTATARTTARCWGFFHAIMSRPVLEHAEPPIQRSLGDLLLFFVA